MQSRAHEDWQVLGHRHCKLLVLFPVRLPPGGSYCLVKREPYPLCSQWHPETYLQHRKNDDSKIRLMINFPPPTLKCLWLSSGREMSCWKLNFVHLCSGGNPMFKINMLVLFEVVCSSKAQLLCLFYAWYSREMQFNLWYKILLKERSFKKKKKKDTLLRKKEYCPQSPSYLSYRTINGFCLYCFHNSYEKSSLPTLVSPLWYFLKYFGVRLHATSLEILSWAQR